MKTVTIAAWYVSVALGNLLVIIITQARFFKSQVSLTSPTSKIKEFCWKPSTFICPFLASMLLHIQLPVFILESHTRLNNDQLGLRILPVCWIDFGEHGGIFRDGQQVQVRGSWSRFKLYVDQRLLRQWALVTLEACYSCYVCAWSFGGIHDVVIFYVDLWRIFEVNRSIIQMLYACRVDHEVWWGTWNKTFANVFISYVSADNWNPSQSF